MKRTLALALTTAAALFTGCSSENAVNAPREHIPATSEIHKQIKKELFLDNLPTDKDGRPVYPDSYAGDFFIFEKWVFLVTDIDSASEYQYLKDGYSNIEFRVEKYSYNYLQSLLDNYKASGDVLPFPEEDLWIDCLNNRAVVWADKEHLSEKREKYFDENIPLYFEELNIAYTL